MSEETKTKAGVAAEAPVKKLRRGVSNDTHAVAQLRYHEKDAASNGLFIGHLEDVRVDWSVNADGSAFAGLKVPRVTLHFASEHKVATEQRHVYQTIFPQPSNVDTIPGGKDSWRVDNVFNWIKHILDVYYLKGRQMTLSEEEALALNFVDYEEEGNNFVYIPVDTEKDVIPAYTTMFENFVAMMNGTFELKDGEVAKPCYKTVDGKFIPAWLKLLRHKKRKNEWVNVGQNGELAFDSFIGNGVIELMRKQGENPLPPSVLRIDVSKESINPKEVNRQPTIGTPGSAMPGGGVMAEGMPMGNAPEASAFNTADGLPF
jgi:hypothetical protein